MTTINILLTNDDGFDAPGLRAAYDGLRTLGRIHVVAPKEERSACSHAITLRRPISVERVEHDHFGTLFTAVGTPADCVRLAVAELIDDSIDLVVCGINRGANAGVDTYYSGTIAGAREAAILRIPAIAVSHAIRTGVSPDWLRAQRITGSIVSGLLNESLPGPGFWSVNLPACVPDDALKRIQRVPVGVHPMPLSFERKESQDGRHLTFEYGASYWLRETSDLSDYSVIRDGGIAISTIPLFGKF